MSNDRSALETVPKSISYAWNCLSIPRPSSPTCPADYGSYLALSPATSQRMQLSSSCNSAYGSPESVSLKPLSITDCMLGADVIHRLAWSIDVIERLCVGYYNYPITCCVIKRLFLNTLSAVRRDIEGNWRGRSRHEIALLISENTRTPLHISASTSALEAHELWTGSKLRWEAIGLIFALAGVTVYLLTQKAVIVALEKCRLPKNPSFKEFSETMATAGNHCQTLYQECGTPNDLSLLFSYMDSLHLANLHGDADPLLWRRMGDVSTEIFTLGFYNISDDLTSVPFWLIEQRKRVIAAAYKSDKTLSSFLNRPPRIPRHFCTPTPPLDLSDDEIVLEGPALGAAVASLDENGWSTDDRVKSTSWARLKLILSQSREELLEISFQQTGEDLSDRLKTIADDLRSTWESLPKKLKEHDSSSPRSVVYSYSTSIDYRHCVFATERLQCRTGNSSPSLLRSSRDLLNEVLAFAKHGCLGDDLEVEILRDLPWFLLYFGLPAAGVLCAELRAHTQEGTPLPSFISRTEVIRNLYVFVSTLGWFNSPEYRYTDLCTAASEKLGDEIDEVINAALCPVSSQAHSVAFGDIEGTTALGNNVLRQHESQPLGPDVSFLAWLDSVDWNNTMAMMPTY
ncbi:hypothetical protein EJ05DRAFT_498630 [Pseudovirgaria hyperparasitica]|uniref:Transcription factor domain-containing protein n=1 Tax=Pseudovirgaria hyperparasitica TaxID=470096 RepID=A0A6A6WHP3_9PEZI|nr:uncharacterized protein EJ05DRAFT_498630 [Pseudovirgaria hyperparasitica]KAF2760671.1 hypothetical protein EJ05DRAFT_498630 [Pseudovirgaria hyperparasitica]